MDASKAGSMLTSEPENASGMLNVCSYIYTIGIGGKFGGNRNVWRKRMHEDFGEEKVRRMNRSARPKGNLGW